MTIDRDDMQAGVVASACISAISAGMMERIRQMAAGQKAGSIGEFS